MKSQNNQLKSADIGHEFCVLTKTKHVGHDSHSILAPEFEFDHDILKISKTKNFQNLVESAYRVNHQVLTQSIWLWGIEICKLDLV